MAIIVNGSALRTLGQPIYVDGKQVLEGYFDGVKCYPDDPDEYPFKYVWTEKKTYSFGSGVYFSGDGGGWGKSSFSFTGDKGCLSYESVVEQTIESNVEVSKEYNQSGEVNGLRPVVMNGESADAWRLKTTVRISTKYHGDGTIKGTGRIYNPFGALIKSWQQTAQIDPSDIQGVLNRTHTFEFYQVFPFVDTTESMYPYPYKGYRNGCPPAMCYGQYHDGEGSRIHVPYASIGMRTTTDLEPVPADHQANGMGRYGGWSILINGVEGCRHICTGYGLIRIYVTYRNKDPKYTHLFICGVC